MRPLAAGSACTSARSGPSGPSRRTPLRLASTARGPSLPARWRARRWGWTTRPGGSRGEGRRPAWGRDNEARRLEREEAALGFEGYDMGLDPPRARLALIRGDLERVEALL